MRDRTKSKIAQTKQNVFFNQFRLIGFALCNAFEVRLQILPNNCIRTAHQHTAQIRPDRSEPCKSGAAAAASESGVLCSKAGISSHMSQPRPIYKHIMNQDIPMDSLS
jgi:hypothetical protein